MNPLNHHFDRSRFSRSIGLRTSRATRKKLGDPAIARCFGLGGHGRTAAAAGWAVSLLRSVSGGVLLCANINLVSSSPPPPPRSVGLAVRRGVGLILFLVPLPPSSRMQPRCKKRGRWHADVSRGKEAEH